MGPALREAMDHEQTWRGAVGTGDACGQRAHLLRVSPHQLLGLKSKCNKPKLTGAPPTHKFLLMAPQ